MSPRAKWGAWIAVGVVLIGLAVGFWVLSRAVNRIPVTPELADSGKARLVEHDSRVMIAYENAVGEQVRIEPNAYFRLVMDERDAMGFGQKFIMKLFNVSSGGSMLFVAIGLLGQALFAGRLIVQWLATERSRKSVVPTAFWWMALSGASMLVVYFVWRKDIVGILGQSTGWIIYVRNLYFIYFQHGLDAETAEAAASTASEEPEKAT
ncbi:MAG: lipid-A-disaccharide synthase N-terminal domain-containing protein [Planctomycetota bacterium]